MLSDFSGLHESKANSGERNGREFVWADYCNNDNKTDQNDVMSGAEMNGFSIKFQSNSYCDFKNKFNKLLKTEKSVTTKWFENVKKISYD